MSELRSTDQRKADVLAVLRQNGDAWLATSDRSGRPHLIAVSTWWDGGLIVIATTDASRTARNLDEIRLGRLGVGSTDDAIMVATLRQRLKGAGLCGLPYRPRVAL